MVIVCLSLYHSITLHKLHTLVARYNRYPGVYCNNHIDPVTTCGANVVHFAYTVNVEVYTRPYHSFSTTTLIGSYRRLLPYCSSVVYIIQTLRSAFDDNMYVMLVLQYVRVLLIPLRSFLGYSVTCTSLTLIVFFQFSSCTVVPCGSFKLADMIRGSSGCTVWRVIFVGC